MSLWGDERFAGAPPGGYGVGGGRPTAADLPRLLELWDEMDEKFGGRQDRPNLFSVPVMVTLVACDGETGTIEGAIYGEYVVDWTAIGTSRKAARQIDALWPTLNECLRESCIRVTRVLVPSRLERQMAKILPQLRNITNAFAQFVFNVRR